MKLFNELGEKIERIWVEEDYNEDLLPAIAAEALKEFKMPEKVTAWDVLDWTLKERILPDQKDLPGRFGDPPITLYNSKRFHIDVYFWLEGTTSIHQHAFCGAFQVLHGGSIHSWYDFDCQHKISSFMEIGEMNLKVCELLQIGDVQEIKAGKQYIHALFHLEQPSATIVVRTHKSPLNLPQFSYYKPYLAIDGFYNEEPTMVKQLQCINAMLRMKRPDTDEYIEDMLNKADFHTSYAILAQLRGLIGHNLIDKLFDLEAPKNRFEKFLSIVVKKHGELGEVIPKLFSHQQIIDEIIQKRQFISDSEQRFFLALLLNVEGKNRIFSLIKQKYPDDAPLDKALDWIFDLSQTKVMGMNVPNALGVENFDDLDLFILENILKDNSDEEVKAIIEKEYPTESMENFDENFASRIQKIKNATIFRPLLA